MKRLVLRLSFAAALACAAPARASTFSVTESGGTFTVSRSGGTGAESVRFRTVGVSAFAGQHFVATNGVLEFGANDTSRQVSVSETTPTTTAYRFQVGATRRYLFELTDEGGFGILSGVRDVETGTGVPASGAFDEKELVLATDGITVTDDGFDQGYREADVAGYFADAAPKSFLSLVLAQLRMTLEFRAREIDDGYQHVQIIANTSDYDDGAKDDDPGTPSKSRYLACFSHGSSKETSIARYSFPVAAAGNGEGATKPWSDLGNTVGDLRKQRFKDDCRAADGRLVLPTALDSLHVRFDAAGKDDDDWIASEVVAKLQAVDSRAPELVRVSSGLFATTPDIAVSPGMHANGNVVRIGVPFQEIVAIDAGDPPSISTSWGELAYEAGDGCNVLTFSGTISAPVGTVLEVTGLSGDVRDLAGNPFAGSVAKTFDGVAVDAPHAYAISCDPAGGALPAGAPTSYTYESGDVAIPAPTRTGYAFAGWTGSNGNVPQTSVAIPAGSHGDAAYAAHWTPNAYAVRFDANGGTGSMPDQPFFYDAAQNLATNAFARTGHRFAGWSGAADGAVVHADGARVSNLASADGAVVTLYAVWTPTPWQTLQNALDAGGTVTLDGDVTASEIDASLAVTNIVTLDLNGHTIDAAGRFGVIRIRPDGDLTLTNGVSESGAITGGNASEGGGVYVGYDGTFAMTGGEISGNTAEYNGGGVSVSGGGAFTMSGGEISGNVANRYGGGVYVGVSVSGGFHGSYVDVGTFTVSGASVVSGNTNSVGAASDVLLADDATIAVDGLSDGARIGVTTATAPAAGDPVRFAEGATEDDRWRFFADDPVYEVRRNSDGDLFLALPVWADLQALLDAGGTVVLGADYAAAEGDRSLVVTNAVTLDLNGHAVRHNGNGEVFHLGAGGDLALTNRVEGAGVVTGGGDHGVYVGDGAVFRLQGGAIADNRTYYAGGGVFVDKGTFEMSGGSITNNGSLGNIAMAGGVYVFGGPFRMTGGTIADNRAIGCGGGVLVEGSGSFEMAGGEILGNMAFKDGGGVYVSDGTVAMSGGAIRDNLALDVGGGVFLDGGPFGMSGGEISGNRGDVGGGVHVSTNAVFAVSGSPVVYGNANDAGEKDNVCLCGAAIAVGDLAAGASIGITTEIAPSAFDDPVAVATGVSAGEAPRFSSDRAGCVLEAGEDGVLRLRRPFTWATLQEGLDEGGTIRLPADCAAGEDDTALEVTNAVVLDLNGHSLAGNGLDAVLYVAGAGELTLTNGVVGAGAVSGGLAGVVVEDGGAFTMDGGAITNNADNWGGGGVLVGIGGTFTMNGGEISGNYAPSGGGVYVYGGDFTMNGGAIADNAAGTGGGVEIDSGYSSDTGTDHAGTFTMNGGAIANNAADWGGGVRLTFGCRFEMNGGEISGNEADSGGGASVGSSGEFEMSGGAIFGNEAFSSGGGVCVEELSLGDPHPSPSAPAPPVSFGGGSFSMAGGSITDNSAAHGGGVSVDGGEMTVSGAPVVAGNANDAGREENVRLPAGATIAVGGLSDGARIGVTTEAAPAAGAPVLFATGATEGDRGRFFGDGGHAVRRTGSDLFLAIPGWADLQALLDAGGTVVLGFDYAAEANDVYLVVTNDVTLDLNGHTVAFNGRQMEVIHVGGGTFTLTNGVEGAGAVTRGGDHGVYVGEGAVFRLRGGAIAGNRTDYAGGGVFVDKGAFEMTGGSVSNNACTGGSMGGGGVYLFEGTFEMSGGTISGNTSAAHGGGVLAKSSDRFEMTGGEISGNAASRRGGGVYLTTSGFAMSGGAIRGNSGGSGGGVFLYDGTFAVSGASVVSGNTNTVGAADNVYLRSGRTIAANNLAAGASIGVTTETAPTESSPVAIAAGASDGDEAYFFSDDPGCLVKHDGGSLWLAVARYCRVDWSRSENVVVTTNGAEAVSGMDYREGTVLAFRPLPGMVVTNVNGETVYLAGWDYVVEPVDSASLVVLAGAEARTKPAWAEAADDFSFWRWVDAKRVADYATADYTAQYLLNVAPNATPWSFRIRDIRPVDGGAEIDLLATAGRGIVDLAAINGVLYVDVGGAVTNLAPKAVPSGNVRHDAETRVATVFVPEPDGAFARARVDFPGFSNGDYLAPRGIAGLAIRPEAGTQVPVGGTIRLRAVGILDNGAEVDVGPSAVWTSSDPEKATVAGGEVLGVEETDAVAVTVRAFGFEASVDVKVGYNYIFLNSVLASVPDIERYLGYTVERDKQVMQNEDGDEVEQDICRLYKDGAEVTDLVLPATFVHGNVPYCVSGLDQEAFLNCVDLRSVTVSGLASYIGVSAFKGCTNLQSVSMSPIVSYIGEYAFANCTALEEVTLPDELTYILHHTFENCSSLTNVVVPAKVLQIDRNAFAGCGSLRTAALPAALESIGEAAFKNCAGLEAMSVPAGITGLPDELFAGCGSLRTVVLFTGSADNPPVLASIGRSAFEGCANLASVSIPGLTVGGTYRGVTDIGEKAFKGCSSIGELTVPDGVERIGDEAFENVQHVTYHGPADGAPWGANAMN